MGERNPMEGKSDTIEKYPNEFGELVKVFMQRFANHEIDIDQLRKGIDRELGEYIVKISKYR